MYSAMRSRQSTIIGPFFYTLLGMPVLLFADKPDIAFANNDRHMRANDINHKEKTGCH